MGDGKLQRRPDRDRECHVVRGDACGDSCGGEQLHLPVHLRQGEGWGRVALSLALRFCGQPGWSPLTQLLATVRTVLPGAPIMVKS